MAAFAYLESLTVADHLALFEQALSSMEEVCSQLEPAEWDLPTDCPGWTVKDNLSHVASYEAVAIGREAAAGIDVSGLEHISQDNALAVANEREIQKRRALPGPAILEEFREATTERLKRLAALDDAGWAADVSRFPWGEVATRDSLPIRVLDVFYHDQDIRRPTGRSGGLGGAVARFAFERLASYGLPRIVAKGAGAPDGSVVVFDVAGGSSVAVRTNGGRGEVTDDLPAAPTVRLATDLETFFCLVGGRWTPERARADRRLTIEGDGELAQRILESMVVVP